MGTTPSAPSLWTRGRSIADCNANGARQGRELFPFLTRRSVPGGSMAFTHSDTIEVKRVKGKGRGVFALRLIRKGEVIERVPMLVFPIEQNTGGTVIADY